MNLKRIALTLCVSFVPLNQAIAFDFTELTRLARGAVAGANVQEAVPGFEILLLKDGQPIYHRAFGTWQIGWHASADSSTKTVSGALMMALQEDTSNNFTLDSRLGDFLPEFNMPDKRDITIRQAFSHTSGISGDEATPLILGNPNITLRQSAFLASQTGLPNGPPGSAFEYGGLSMQAAGAAAEVSTGESYTDLMQQYITGPLGMDRTEFVIASDSNPRVAGGLQSTAEDFGRLMDMLLNDGIDRATGNRILSAAAVAEMLTQQTTDDQTIVGSPVNNHRYGIGTWLDQLGPDYIGGANRPVDALAAGARGFHSWTDESEGLVFVFATDLTRVSNLLPLSARMHSAIIEAVETVPEPTTGAMALLGLGTLSIVRNANNRRE